MRQLSRILLVSHPAVTCHRPRAVPQRGGSLPQRSLRPPRYVSASGRNTAARGISPAKLSQCFASACGYLWASDALDGCFGFLLLPSCSSSPEQTCPAAEDDGGF